MVVDDDPSMRKKSSLRILKVNSAVIPETDQEVSGMDKRLGDISEKMYPNDW